MKKSIVSGCAVALLLKSLVGCEKQSADAVVIGKVKEGEEIKDPRATNHEQWIVKVWMRDNGRTIEVRADRAQWEKLHESDQVKLTYRVGKYTRTVWDAEVR